MKRLLFYSLTLLLLSPVCLQAQMNLYSWQEMISNPNLHKTLPQQYEQYMRSTYTDTDTMPRAYKHYARYMKYWHNRLGVDAQGNLSYEPYFDAIMANREQSVCNGNDPAHWELLDVPITEGQEQGLFTEILPDPDYSERYLISSNYGGLWKFNPSNNRWYNVTDDLGMPGLSATDFLRSRFDHNIIFAATGHGQWRTRYGVGLLQSFDRGETWEINQAFLAHVGTPYARLVRLVPNPNDNNASDGLAFYAASPKDIYYTPDNGQTWQTISPSLNLPNGEEIIDMEITDDNRILIGTEYKWDATGAHMYVLQNNTWDTIHLSSLGSQRYRISTPDHHTIFALKDADDGKRRIYKSTDNGYNWTPLQIQSFGGVSHCHEIEYSYNSNSIFTSNTQGKLHIYNGTTGGLLPHMGGGHVDIRDIYIAQEDSTEVIYYGNDGGVSKYIYKDYDGNVINEFYNLNGDYLPCNNVVGFGVANTIGEHVIAAATHQGRLNIHNGFVVFNYTGGDNDDVVFHPNKEYLWYSPVTRHHITDGSNSIWGGEYGVESYIGMKLVLNPNNPDILYFPSKKHHLGIYNDATKEVAHKATISTENDTLGRVGAIGIAANNDIYIAHWNGLAHDATAKLMVSDNAGNTWQDLSLSTVWEQQNNSWQQSGTLSQLTPWCPIHSIVCNPQNSNELWISIGGVGQKDHLRVLHSTDGGSNWYDYSLGLSEFPITKMLYDYPTGTLFAGTDAGVFYRQPFANNDSKWQCFSNGLPMGGTSDMEINNCARKLYISMNGRGVFHSPIPFPEINSGSGLTPEPGYIVTSDEVWDSPRVFTDNVIVMPNVSLSINAPCYFAENTGIKVKPAGKLYVNAELTTKECVINWNGIEAGGQTLLPPTPQNQAMVYINEGAVISYAKVGVCDYLRDDNGSPEPFSYGGIIKANKAAFIDNYISCDIQRYAQGADVISKLEACDINQSKFVISFECYTLFDYEKQPPTFINILDNKKVNIRNNTFFTSITNLNFLSQHRLPTAVKATNSAVRCTNNTFKNCEYGIYSLDYEPRVATDVITDNTFHNCINGIYQHGTSGSCLVGNTLISAMHLPPIYNYQASRFTHMYLDRCNNYILENNMLRGHFVDRKALHIGLIINDGGPNDQIINNNTLVDLDYAILAQGNNRNATGSTGLSFKCNQFNRNRFDISVSALPGTPNAGIAALQGSNDDEPTAPAGNRFNIITSTAEGHFHNIPNNLGAIVTYYHHKAPTEYLKRKLIPGYVDPTANLIIGVNVQENTGQEWDDVNIHCPSIYSKGWTEKQSLLAGQQQIAQNSQTQLRLWTDQGDTPAMAQEIDNSSGDEAFALRNQLLNTSPYLSQEVLQKVTAKEQVLNNALLRDVLVVNPQAAKDPGVLQALNNRVQPMPESMEQQILAGQTRVGAKEALEAIRHQAQGLYNNTLTAMQAGMQNDSSNTFTTDSLLQLLSHAHNIDSRYRLAAFYQAQDNTAALQTIWQNMVTDFQLSASQQQEAVDMQSYLGFLKQLRNETGSLPDSLQSDAQQALQNWHENSGNRVGALAQNALIATHAIDYTPPLILPDLENYSPQQAYIVDDKMAETPPEVRFEVYPNPAKDYIIADYKIEKPYSHASLQIVEVGTARLCQSIDLHTANNAKTIALQGLSVGTYTIYLQIDGKKSLSYTFEIIK